MKTINKYLAEAIDCYPNYLEGTIEALDYALSYDENSTMALCLYGRLMSEQLMRYEEARSFFERALAADITAVEVYPHLIRALTASEDYADAKRVADYASTVKGANRYEVAMATAALYEKMRDFDAADAAVKEAKLHHACRWDFNEIEELEKRIKLKRDLVSGKKKSAKGKKGKKSKKIKA